MNVKVGQRWMFDAKAGSKYILEVLSISDKSVECKIVQRFNGTYLVGSVDWWSTLPLDGRYDSWWTYLEGQDVSI
jgi:hypothetical protein